MTTVTPLPPAPNPLTDSQSAYNSKALAFAQALPPLVTEINTVSGEMNTAASNAAASAGTATAQAVIATTKASEADTSADDAAASAAAAALALASLPAGSINDSLTDATHTYSSSKLVATFGRLVTANIWTAAQTFQSSLAETPVVASVSGNYALPDRSWHDLTVTANTTFEFPVAANGKAFTVWLKQGGAGGWTYAFPANVRPANGTTYIPTAAAGKTDTLTFAYDGAYWLMYVGAQNATRA